MPRCERRPGGVREVGVAEHRDLALAPALHAYPFKGVVAVIYLADEWVARSLRPSLAANILRDQCIATCIDILRDEGQEGQPRGLVVARAHEDDRS